MTFDLDYVRLLEHARAFIVAGADPGQMAAAMTSLEDAYNDQRPNEPGLTRQEILKQPDARRSALLSALSALLDSAVGMRRQFETQLTKAKDELAAELARKAEASRKLDTAPLTKLLGLMVSFLRQDQDIDFGSAQIHQLIVDHPELAAVADEMRDALACLNSIRSGFARDAAAVQRIANFKKALDQL